MKQELSNKKSTNEILQIFDLHDKVKNGVEALENYQANHENENFDEVITQLKITDDSIYAKALLFVNGKFGKL